MLKDDLNSPRLRHASSQDKRWSISMFLLFILRDELIISPHFERSWRIIFMHNLSSPKTSKSRDLPFIYSVRNYSLIFLRTNIQSGLAKKTQESTMKNGWFLPFLLVSPVKLVSVSSSNSHQVGAICTATSFIATARKRWQACYHLVI